jgi:glycosyltransferase involved in cell wall biosynthesis
MLVEAWTEVRKTHAVDLVLAGRRRRDGPEFAPRPGLRLLGEVPDESLPHLYSNAAALVYPSLYEGFGLPVLEAMQCGAAVIASRDPAISEIAGEAAILLDARDPAQWAATLTAALNRPEWLEDLRQRGRRRALEFSWARTARATREAYDEAVRRF